MNNKIIDFPKIKSPFVRENINGKYIVTPEIEEGYNWVFEDQSVLAVDKLHGTNICCIFENGKLMHVDNRSHRLIEEPCICSNFKTETFRTIEGILRAFERNWIDKDFTGRMYGELVGPTINGNLHQLDRHYFVPSDRDWEIFIYPITFKCS